MYDHAGQHVLSYSAAHHVRRNPSLGGYAPGGDFNLGGEDFPALPPTFSAATTTTSTTCST